MGIEPPPQMNGEFVTEGTFLAVPACFPGVSLPPPAGELRMRALHLSRNGRDVFATTHGPHPHLLQFLPKGSFGYAVDLGCPEGAIDLTAVLTAPGRWAETLLVAGASEQGAFLTVGRAAVADAGIQEWSVNRKTAAVRLDLPVPRVAGITCSGGQILAWGCGQGFFLRWDAESLTLEKVVPFENTFSRIPFEGDLLTSELRRAAIDWSAGTIVSQMLPGRPERPVACIQAFPGGAVWADDLGNICEHDGVALAMRGRIPWLPVHSLCRLPDGRIYASAGTDIAHWVVLEKSASQARDLGVPVSTLAARRYGFQFSHLQVGSDGEIYAAENDRGGHLWIYFPPQQSQTAALGIKSNSSTQTV